MPTYFPSAALLSFTSSIRGDVFVQGRIVTRMSDEAPQDDCVSDGLGIRDARTPHQRMNFMPNEAHMTPRNPASIRKETRTMTMS